MAPYTISQGLVEGVSQQIAGLAYDNKAAAIRVARQLACRNTDPSVTDIYVDDGDDGCVFHKLARRAG